MLRRRIVQLSVSALVALTLVLGLTGLAVAQSQAVKPKAGATCAKKYYNKTVKVKGKKFTCVKSGSKWVWKKG